MAMVISKIPSEFLGKWKKYIYKRQPVIENVFYFTDEIVQHLGMMAVVYQIP